MVSFYIGFKIEKLFFSILMMIVFYFINLCIMGMLNFVLFGEVIIYDVMLIEDDV